MLLSFLPFENTFKIREFLQCRFQYLKMLDRSPSVQSLVVGSNTPYSSMTLLSFGLMVYNLVCTPNLSKTKCSFKLYQKSQIAEKKFKGSILCAFIYLV